MLLSLSLSNVEMENFVGKKKDCLQALVAKDKTIRDTVLKELNLWLSTNPRHSTSFFDSEWLDIWRGLLYSMWMQDEPLMQEELSHNISNLVHSLPEIGNSLRFVNGFLETIAGEWSGIERLGLVDKFMMMVRDMLHQTFLLMSKGDWQEYHCCKFSESIYEQIMRPHDPDMPDGLKFQLADVFLDELRKVPLEQLTNKTMLILLQPFIDCVLFTRKPLLALHIVSRVIFKVLKLTLRRKAAKGQDADKTNQLVDTEMKVKTSKRQKAVSLSFNLDKAMLLKWMSHLAGRKLIRPTNREFVYILVKRLEDCTKQTSSVELGQSGSEEIHFVCETKFILSNHR